MEFVTLALGETLYESGSHLRHVYFPVSGVVSLLIVTEDGGSAEIAVIGNDGCVGIALLLGGETTLDRAVVQIAGHAYRLPAEVVLREFKRGHAAQLLLLRYIQALMTQTAQTAVCNRHHTVEQQLCRWLLLTLDRVPSTDVVMTQELISNMLGVRRSGVTQAARDLQRAGLIEYERGHIRVLARERLEAHACECYAVVKRETDRLLPDALE
jgi:CRP-like cAMP-binding protein